MGIVPSVFTLSALDAPYHRPQKQRNGGRPGSRGAAAGGSRAGGTTTPRSGFGSTSSHDGSSGGSRHGASASSAFPPLPSKLPPAPGAKRPSDSTLPPLPGAKRASDSALPPLGRPAARSSDTGAGAPQTRRASDTGPASAAAGARGRGGNAGGGAAASKSGREAVLGGLIARGEKPVGGSLPLRAVNGAGGGAKPPGAAMASDGSTPS